MLREHRIKVAKWQEIEILEHKITSTTLLRSLHFIRLSPRKQKGTNKILLDFTTVWGTGGVFGKYQYSGNFEEGSGHAHTCHVIKISSLSFLLFIFHSKKEQ